MTSDRTLQTPWCPLQAFQACASAQVPAAEEAPAAQAEERIAVAEAAGPSPAAAARSGGGAPPAAADAHAAGSSAIPNPTSTLPASKEDAEEELDLPDAPTTRLEPSQQLAATAAKRGAALAVEEPLPA
jgi:hypothetical protein